MTKLTWGLPGTRYFEAGADQGVLFVGGLVGVPWNGLISIDESPSGGEAKPLYLDGIRYLNISAAEEFDFSINAYTAPREFGLCDGARAVAAGLSITNQPRKPFDLTYRTKIGNEIDGLDHGYKIHLVYNAMAAPSERAYQTMGQQASPIAFKWDVTTSPEDVPGIKPTAHLIIDSRRADRVAIGYLEGILYGAEGMDPRMPEPDEVLSILGVPTTGVSFKVNLLGEATSAVQSITSLPINPSFETAGAVNQEIRRNYHVNPGAPTYTNWNLWAGTNHVSTRTTENVSWSPSGKAQRQTWTSIGAGTAGSQGPEVGPAALIIGSGVVMTAVVRTVVSRDGMTLTSPSIDSNGAQVTTIIARSRTGTITAVAGVVYEDWITFSATTIDVAARLMVGTAVKLVGDWTESSMADVYPGAYDPFRPWVYGGNPADADSSYAFVGTVDASASIQNGTRVGNTANMQNGQSIRSSLWKSNGTYSLRTIPTATNNDNTVVVAGTPGGSTLVGQGVTLVAGKTYTAYVTCRVLTAQTGTLNANARRIQVVTNNVTGWTGAISVFSPAAPNVPGEYQLSVTFTIPADAVTGGVRLMNGALQGGGEIWWDDFLIIEVSSPATPYVGPYFHGGLPVVYKGQKTVPVWLATPHASASRMDYLTLLETPGNVGDMYIIDDDFWVFTPDNYWQQFGSVPV